MANSILTQLAREYNLKVKGLFATDVVDRIPVRLSVNQYVRAAVVCDRAYYDKIKSQIPGGFASYEHGQVFFTVSNGNPVNSYQKIRETIKEVFAEYYDDPVCPYCKCQMCDTAAFHNNLYVPVHKRCYENAIADAASKRKKGNIFIGTFLAFVVCTVILLFNVIDILTSEEEYTVIYALAPVFAGIAYAWKGRRGIPGRICATVASLLSYCLCMHVTLAGELAQARGIGLVEAALTRVPTIMNYVFSGFFIDNVFDVFMFVLGLVCCFFVAGLDLDARDSSAPELVRPINL